MNRTLDLNKLDVPKMRTTEVMRKLLLDPDTFATTMLVIVLDLWGDECMHDPEDPERGPWHPTTFRSMLEDHFGIQLPKCNLDKLMAALTIISTDLFFTNLDRFIVLANILAGDEFDPQEFEKADALECAWAITEALLLDPPDDDNQNPFSEEIRHYIGFVLQDEGFVTPPDVLKIAIDGDFADHVRYNFSDDPEMFAAIYDVQQSKATEVEEILRENLLALQQQLQVLPLSEGSTQELTQRFQQLLQMNEAPDTTGPENVL